MNPFFALSPEGEERWNFAARGVWIGAMPSIGSDGTLYVGDGDRQRGELRGHLYALTPAGELRWVYTTSGWVKYGPALAADGTAYVAAGERLHAVRHGRRAWIFQAEDSIDVQPVLGPDGTVYFGTRAGRFHALSPDGERKWTVELAEVDGFHRRGGEEFDPPPKWGQVLTAAAVGDNGHIYLGSRHGLLVALAETGKVRWTRKMAGDFMGPGDIRLGPGGTLYVANDEGLRAIATDADGPANSPWPQYGGDLAGRGRQP